MENLKNFIQTNQQKLVLGFAFVLISALAFGLGRFSQTASSDSQIKLESDFTAPINYTPDVSGVQTTSTTTPAKSSALDCTGKIKGTSSMIYHVPGDPFYTRTTKPTACFDTEAEAQAAGFKKSGK